MESFTELEEITLQELKKGDEYEDIPSLCFEDLQWYTKIPANQLRGVLTSLENKKAIKVNEYPNGLKAFGYNLPS